jgi:hypothetical protein
VPAPVTDPRRTTARRDLHPRTERRLGAAAVPAVAIGSNRPAAPDTLRDLAHQPRILPEHLPEATRTVPPCRTPNETLPHRSSAPPPTRAARAGRPPPVREIGRVRDPDPEPIEGWTGGGKPDEDPDDQYFVHDDEQQPRAIRTEYLSDLLKISHTPGALDTYLLYPRVVTPDGEWEAWYFAHRLPGAARHRSFRDLMHDEYRRLRGDRW